MASRIPTYILAPNWDIPVDGPVALGSIVADPRNPTASLNKATRVPIPAGEVVRMNKQRWSRTSRDLLEGRVGIFATFLAPLLGVGADVAASAHRHGDDVYSCDVLETAYFDPDDRYIADSLALPMVKRYMSQRRSVYMVTGCKIARGGAIETTAGRGHGAELKVGFDGTQSGVPLGGGPKAGYEKGKALKTRFGKSDDFVIAYQLIRIKVKSDGSFEQKAYNKLALMDDDDDAEAEGKPLRESWDISEVVAAVDELQGMRVIPGICEEDESECLVISR
ncbi:hypothetical protein MBLNU459_g4259t1 [Dothideomycetes sp. NU459]